MARITTDQTIVVSIEPQTASGNPASIDGNAEFSINDLYDYGSFEQLSPTSARFTPSGRTGAVQVRVVADADLDAGETRHLEASGALEIVTPEEEATVMAISFGSPE